MVKICDAVMINCLLDPETESLFDQDMISKMKPEPYILDTARGNIFHTLSHSRRYSWLGALVTFGFLGQPPRIISGAPCRGTPCCATRLALRFQPRLAMLKSVQEILECYFGNCPLRTEYLSSRVQGLIQIRKAMQQKVAQRLPSLSEPDAAVLSFTSHVHNWNAVD